MGDIATGYQSGESVLSDKHSNFLSTILEECNEDVLADGPESSTDRSHGLESSEVEHTDTYVESDQPIPRQCKDGKRRKKVAFVLPTQRHEDWISESYYDGNDEPGSQDWMESIRSLVSTEVVSSPKGLRVCDASQSTINRRLRTLKDVFDILEMPELSAIFKGFDSDCCDQEGQQLNDQMSSQKSKKKKDRGKNDEAKSRGRRKGEKKIEKPIEYKCDHSKIMRNEDGTRVEVDHHFRNSKNPTLLSWLEKKEKEIRQKRKEERQAKKQERIENRMKNLALSERKHLSDTLVKDWMAKKRKELKKKFRVKRVEPDAGLPCTASTKEYQAPPGYMPVNTFSPEAISNDSPSQFCASDSGISTTSFNSHHNELVPSGGKTPCKKLKSKRNTQGNTSEMESSLSSIASSSEEKDHSFNANAMKNKPDVHSYFRKAPKSVWADNLMESKTNELPTKKVSKKKGVKLKLDFVKVISQDTASREDKVDKRSTRKSKKRKTMRKNKIEGDQEKVRGNSKGKGWAPHLQGASDNDKELETKVILKEARRRIEEKEMAKRRVYSTKTDKKRSSKRVTGASKLYQWASEESNSDRELNEPLTDVESKQRPEPQGSENACIKSPRFESDSDHIDNFAMNVLGDFQEKRSTRSKESCLAHEDEQKSNPQDVSSRHTSDTDIDSNEIDTDISESDLTDTSPALKLIQTKESHVKQKSSISLAPTDPKINTMVENKQFTPQREDIVMPHLAGDKMVKRIGSETNVVVQDRTVIKEVNRTQNKDFNDCLDFFLDDYQRPWKEL